MGEFFANTFCVEEELRKCAVTTHKRLNFEPKLKTIKKKSPKSTENSRT
jgi:hypothetical protein